MADAVYIVNRHQTFDIMTFLILEKLNTYQLQQDIGHYRLDETC